VTTSPALERVGARATARPSWLRRYVATLVGFDVLAAVLAAMTTVLVRYDGRAALVAGVDYRVLAVLFVPLWLAVLAVTGAYDRSVVGVGTEEFRRVVGAAVRALAVVGVLIAGLKLDLARSVIAVGLPGVAFMTLLGRWTARRALHAARRRGRWCHRVLVVGDVAACASLMNRLERHTEAGLRVVAACTTSAISTAGLGVPVVTGLANATAAARSFGVDTIAVAETGSLGDEGLRRLAWSIEGQGIDLLVAPGLTYVAVPRIVVRPVDGSPLLHVEEPTLTGPKLVVKGAFDRVGAFVLLAVAAVPVLLLAALVRLTSRGPAFFRQTRIGRGGREFRIWKLRTMRSDADVVTVDGNDADGLLFKLREDPRVTPLGRVLRRWSLDEVPQLINVLLGSMSLVGPRPPLASEVAQYGGDVRRRLLVKPGLTGLWQVSGRSDLPWDEAVQLDLQYVENWSLSLDITILARTAVAVLRRCGAY
jgi:exopolysaccharide biosynthesis polyprenyl glycosylphosphotransferase